MNNEVLVGLGSNVAPESNIKKARAYLKKNFNVIGESSFMKTKPVGLTNQPDFINGAVLISTDMPYNAVDAQLKQAEVILGRTSTTKKYGPRVIDFDIILWNREIVDQDFYQRPFLQKSVYELIPAFDHQK